MSFWSKLREEPTAPAGSVNAIEPSVVVMPPPAPPVPPPQAATKPTKPTQVQEPISMAMLKREEMSSIPAASGDLNALLGRGSEFEGKLTFEGTVRIDGKFTGTIVTNDVLVIGEGAKVNAEISCGTIVVHGEINGNVKAKNAVELHHPARMKGNIETPSLMIEKGVQFEGASKMEGLDKAAKPVPAPVAAVK